MEASIQLFVKFLIRALPLDTAEKTGNQIAEKFRDVLLSPASSMKEMEEILARAFEEVDMAKMKREFIWSLPSMWFEWAESQVASDSEAIATIGDYAPARGLVDVLFEMYGEAGTESQFVP